MPAVVIVNASLDGARVVVDVDALRDWELRGWTAVGPCSDPARAPLRTDGEQAEADAAEAARIAALLSPAPAAAAGRTDTPPARAAANPKE